jgi:hypothetical protein
MLCARGPPHTHAQTPHAHNAKTHAHTHTRMHALPPPGEGMDRPGSPRARRPGAGQKKGRRGESEEGTSAAPARGRARGARLASRGARAGRPGRGPRARAAVLESHWRALPPPRLSHTHTRAHMARVRPAGGGGAHAALRADPRLNFVMLSPTASSCNPPHLNADAASNRQAAARTSTNDAARACGRRPAPGAAGACDRRRLAGPARITARSSAIYPTIRSVTRGTRFASLGAAPPAQLPKEAPLVRPTAFDEHS